MSPRFGRLLVPGLTTLAMLAVLIGLGTWQVSRLRWKTQILAEVARAEADPARPLMNDPPAFAKLRVTGRLRATPTALYGAEVRQLPTGPEMGSHLIVVLDRPDGRPVLIDRGWVSTRAPAAPTSPDAVTVEGYVRTADAPSWFAATDDIANRRFYTLNPPAIAAALGAPDAEPFVLVLLGGPGFPDPMRHLPRPANNHLIYAMTWYGFAITLAIIFILWARKDRGT